MSASLSIPNEMILASAGSGKTWQLTNRFIALMGQQWLAKQDVTPERIVAVTFTRKAAGEFFDAILEKLARAASSAKYAAALAGDESIDPEVKNDPLPPILRQLKPEDYRHLLRIFIARMPRLFLGTLDSFFSSILRSFPAEFGLAGDFEILSEHLAAEEREGICRMVFRRTLPGGRSGKESMAAQQDFLEAFRRATFGKEEASIRSVLDQFIEGQHEIMLHAGREELWGEARTIWPAGCRWLRPRVDLGKEFDKLLKLFASEDLTDGQRDFWAEFREQAIAHVPGNALPSRVKFFVEKLLAVWNEVVSGGCELTVSRNKQKLSGSACGILEGIVTTIVGGEIVVRLERTRGVWQVLRLFEDNWSNQVRRRGRLTFQDMELILAGHEFAHDLPKPVLSQVPGEDDRLRIDYRLDARYDHWLLDEFQDTNHVQWSVIENLIDEVVQDSSDQRTLFQVGDVKQAIYAWRGGDTRLFHEVFERYSAGDQPRIKERPLNVSWRSGHDVIDMVNRVFGSDKAFVEMELPVETRQRWPWKEHKVAGVNDELPGYAVLLNPKPSNGDKVEEEDRFALVVGVLEEIQPVARGLSCAILVQANDTGRELVDYIRAHSPSRIPVMCESEIAVATDNPVTLALLSLFQCAAHPGDTFAWEHLRMTPLRKVIHDAGKTPGALAHEVLRMIFDQGFEAALRHWVSLLEEKAFALDEFSRRRVDDLALAARLFDQDGGRDVDDFLAFVRGYTVREPDTRSAVQVMTIHKSKGLTFDCVILPDLEGNSMSTVRRGIGVKRGPRNHIEWVFDLPPSDIVKADPVLAEYREEREAEAAYEELCKFYVALTRARYANYLITSPRSKKSTSNNFIKLLDLTLAASGKSEGAVLGGVQADLKYASATSATQRAWYELVKTKDKPEPAAEEASTTLIEVPARVRPVRRTPSGSETSVVTARQLFSRGGRFARAFGTLVHAWFEQIEWLDEMDESTLAAKWSAVVCPEDVLRERVEEEVQRCLASADVRAAMNRPSAQAELWREKRFEILLGNEWLSGTFDRVVIEPHQATIIDFKTDKVTTPEAFAERVDGYRPQLLTYREVIHRMTGLPLSAIRCRLIFTHRCEVVEV